MTMTNLYREEKKHTAAATTVTLYSQYCPADRQRWVNLITAMDDTTATALVDIGIDRGGVVHYLTTIALSVAASYYEKKLETLVNPGERLVFNFRLVVAADVLKVFITGIDRPEE